MLEQLKNYLAEKKYRLALTAILLAAFGLRLNMFFGPMQYDEIWSLGYIGNAVGRIFTDLATPNNHPLNTLLMKLWSDCFDVKQLPQLTRLHSLIFGMLSVVLTGVLARGIFHSRAAALFAMLFVAFDPAAVCYSDLARGYSTQLFFLLCFACGLVWSGRLRRFLPWRYLPEAAMIVGALGATLAVPSAPIFLAATVISARCYRRKVPDASVLIALGVAAALVAIYLGINQAGLREAQSKFGSRFTEPGEMLGFVLMIAQDFFALAVAPFLLVTAAIDRRRGMLLLLCAALIVGSAAFVSAGPSRVYLPLCVLVALGCGRGAHALMTVALCRDNRKLARIIAVSAVFLAGLGYTQLYGTWHLTDYCSWLKTGQSMPQEYLVAYPATAGYPLRWNNDREELALDQAKRRHYRAPGTRPLLCFAVDPGRINGMNAAGGEEVRELGVPGTKEMLNGFPAVKYLLHPTETPRPGEWFLAVLPDRDLTAWEALGAAKCDMLVLNPYFQPCRVICGKAPEDAAVWRTVRDAGAKVYAFAPAAGAKK